MDQLILSIDFAARKHSRQRRKDPAASPYINHPIEVMKLLSQCGITDVEILQSAVLHDTLEDTETSLSELTNLFGSRVANMVNEVTYEKQIPQIQRKQLEIDSIPHCSKGAQLIKQADKISNLTTIASSPPINWSSQRITGFIHWSYFIFKQCRGNNQQLDEITDKLMKQLLTKEPTQQDVQEYYKLLETTKQST